MNGRGWSADEIGALRRLVAAGWTDARIGEALGRARETVQAASARRSAWSRASRRR